MAVGRYIHDGAFDISATVKAYFALKMIGDRADAPHMKRAREAILARGGADRANVFTRILLALYGETSWKNVPTVPVELILLPRWFPIHLSKMSYWARTVMVPLLVLAALKPVACNPRNIACRRVVSVATPAGTETRAAPEPLLVRIFHRSRLRAEGHRSVLAEKAAQARHRQMRWLRHRTP